MEAVTAQLASSFSAAVADGKRTFYAQASSPDIHRSYTIATDAMVGMFASESYQAAMASFLSRKKS